ncbi:hypothetical protein PUN4_140032 [Paraburkholderia unamae]|nr:hypothetical protein PUN4_140032 [Paraburkholderia unamae]
MARCVLIAYLPHAFYRVGVTLFTRLSLRLYLAFYRMFCVFLSRHYRAFIDYASPIAR